MTIPTNWYEDFFYGVSLDLWRKAISPKQTTSEADFLVTVLSCDKGSHLLDVPCGNGRLSLELARRGFRMTGVDLAEEFVEEDVHLRQAWAKINRPVPQAVLTGSRKPSLFSATCAALKAKRFTTALIVLETALAFSTMPAWKVFSAA